MTRSAILREWRLSAMTGGSPFNLKLFFYLRFDYASRTALVALLSAKLPAQGGRIKS